MRGNRASIQVYLPRGDAVNPAASPNTILLLVFDGSAGASARLVILKNKTKKYDRDLNTCKIYLRTNFQHERPHRCATAAHRGLRDTGACAVRTRVWSFSPCDNHVPPSPLTPSLSRNPATARGPFFFKPPLITHHFRPLPTTPATTNARANDTPQNDTSIPRSDKDAPRTASSLPAQAGCAGEPLNIDFGEGPGMLRGCRGNNPSKYFVFEFSHSSSPRALIPDTPRPSRGILTPPSHSTTTALDETSRASSTSTHHKNAVPRTLPEDADPSVQQPLRPATSRNISAVRFSEPLGHV